MNLRQQKILMGIVEDSYATTMQTPVTLLQKISELKINAENVVHYAEMSARSFKKITDRLKDFEKTALESPEILEGESKTVMNLVRMGLEQIDKSQSTANNLLKHLDFMMANTKAFDNANMSGSIGGGI